MEKFIRNDASRQSTKPQHHLPGSTGCQTAASPEAAYSLFLEHFCSSNTINQTRKTICSMKTKIKQKTQLNSVKKKNHTAFIFDSLLFQLNLFPNLVSKFYSHQNVHVSKTGNTKADTRAQAGDPMEAKSCLQGINTTAAGCITIA